MMNKKHSSIDGFVPRRDHGDTTRESAPFRRTGLNGGARQDLEMGDTRRHVTTVDTDTEARRRQEIGEVLESIHAEPEESPRPKRRWLGLRGPKKGKKPKKPTSRRRKIVKRVLLILGIILLLAGGWMAYRVMVAGGNIFQGNIFDLIQSKPLRQDANGRSNILVFGTADDSEGGTHEGGNLTDSIMVLSVNQTTNEAFMVSLPRDLYVQHDPVCPILGTNAGKLNETYFCHSRDGEDETAGAAGLQEMAGTILGIDIHYYVHVNFSVVVDAVDAVGGVEVTIESNPAGMGILDRNFDWVCNYECYYVRYDDGEIANLDGEHALALARARNAQGGYGLAAGNFDREQNQQKIMKALLDKSVSAGTLANPARVLGLVEAMGDNLRTNFEAAEIRTLMRIGGEIEQSNIASLPLTDSDEGIDLVRNSNIGGASVVVPSAGLHVYTDIHTYIRLHSSNDPMVREQARIAVYNGGTVAGAAQIQADALSEQGIHVTAIGNAPEGNYGSVQIYRVNPDKPATEQALARLLGATVHASVPPFPVPAEVDFVVVVGNQAVAQR